jgi:hypothetical protein
MVQAQARGGVTRLKGLFSELTYDFRTNTRPEPLTLGKTLQGYNANH